MMNPVKLYLEENLDDSHVVIISDVNNFMKTWKGLEQCGINLTDFVYSCCNKYHPKYISFIGHSLGGLIIRNCIGILDSKKFFDDVIPILYSSIATPHLGIFYLNNLKQTMAKYFIGLTGKELLVKDKNKLLIFMSQYDTYYYHED